MEKINKILDNCKGDIDVAEIARMVSELNLPLIDVLAVASGAVEHRRRRREFLENKTTTTTAAATTDHGDNAAVIDVVDDDDGEAVMLKHDQRLGKKRPSVSNPPSCYPRKKLKPHVEEREILFRREKDSSDETIVAETPPLPLLKQGSLEIQENVSALPNRFSYLPIKKRMTEGGFAFSDPVSEKERLMSEEALIKNMSTEPESPPELLIETRNKITAMGGTDLKLIIQKPLGKSDWLKGEGRLSIPIDQIRATDFLTNKEKSKLGTNQDGTKFELLDPNGELQTPSLRGWEMEKSNPKFVLVSKWSIVVQDNQLRMDDVIQLWSFRIDSKLYFALVKVEDGRNNNRGGSGSNEGESSEIGSK